MLLVALLTSCPEEPWSGDCIGDVDDCRAATAFVQEQWPAGSWWESPGASVRIIDVHEVECGGFKGYGFGGDGCFYLSVFDGVHNGSVYVRVADGDATEMLDPWPGDGSGGYPVIRTPEPDDEAK